MSYKSTLDRFPSLLTVVYQMALLGATQSQMAAALGVSVKTVEYWMVHRADFADAVRRGQTLATAQVADSLFRCALGYDYTEEQVLTFRGVVTDRIMVTKHRPANPWAAYKILSLRQRDTWQDTHRVDVTQRTLSANFTVDLTDISTEELAMLKRLALNARNGDSDDDPTVAIGE